MGNFYVEEKIFKRDSMPDRINELTSDAFLTLNWLKYRPSPYGYYKMEYPPRDFDEYQEYILVEEYMRIWEIFAPNIRKQRYTMRIKKGNIMDVFMKALKEMIMLNRHPPDAMLSDQLTKLIFDRYFIDYPSHEYTEEAVKNLFLQTAKKKKLNYRDGDFYGIPYYVTNLPEITEALILRHGLTKLMHCKIALICTKDLGFTDIYGEGAYAPIVTNPQQIAIIKLKRD